MVFWTKQELTGTKKAFIDSFGKLLFVSDEFIGEHFKISSNIKIYIVKFTVRIRFTVRNLSAYDFVTCLLLVS